MPPVSLLARVGAAGAGAESRSASALLPPCPDAFWAGRLQSAGFGERESSRAWGGSGGGALRIMGSTSKISERS